MKIDLDYIYITDKAGDWKEAINLSSLPLLNNNCITKDYVPSIFESIEKDGMYIIIDPRIALPHTRPENGALKNGISILKSNVPIKFNENYPEVKLVIMFCSVDSSSHIEMLTDLSVILADEAKLNKLFESKTREELWRIINEEN